MKPLQLAQDILPIGAGKGQAAAVLPSPESDDQFLHRKQFFAAVDRGLADADAGRVVSDEELGRELDDSFGALTP